MGKKLIIPGADFSQNAIALNEITFKVKANGSVTMYYNSTSGNKAYGTFNAEGKDEVYSVQIDNYIGKSDYRYPYRMFDAQEDLKECSINDLNGVFTEYLNTLRGCTSLEKVRIKTPAKIVALSETFKDCSSLIEIKGLADIDTSTATNFSSIFRGTALTELSLNGWNMSNCTLITKFVNLFYGMTNLTTLDLSNTVLSSQVAADVYTSGHGGSSGYHFSGDMTNLTKIYVDNVSADDIAYWLSWVNQIGRGYTFTQQTVTEGGVERQALVRNA